MKVRKKTLYIVIPLISVMVIALWSSGLFGIWTVGMADIANNTKDFSKTGELIGGEYSMKLDLSDFESNLGKEIYNDGEHRIYVSWLQKTNRGGYDIGFRSSGIYSLSGASLISGQNFKNINNHSFTRSTTAKLTVEFDDKIYNAVPTGGCGINYKDGDCFSFGFYLSDKANENNLEDLGIKLTVTDLYNNVWRKR